MSHRLDEERMMRRTGITLLIWLLLPAMAHAVCSNYATEAWRVNGTPVNATGSTITLTVPNTITTHDVCLAHISWLGAQTVNTVPTGWTLVATARDAVGNSIQSKVYWATGLTANATKAWALSGSVEYLADMVCLTHVDKTTPINASSNYATTSNGLTITAAGLTTTINNEIVLDFFSSTTGTADGSEAWYPPAGVYERVESIGTNISTEIGSWTQTTAGAGGSSDLATYTYLGTATAIQVALTPACRVMPSSASTPAILQFGIASTLSGTEYVLGAGHDTAITTATAPAVTAGRVTHMVASCVDAVTSGTRTFTTYIDSTAQPSCSMTVGQSTCSGNANTSFNAGDSVQVRVATATPQSPCEVWLTLDGSGTTRNHNSVRAWGGSGQYTDALYSTSAYGCGPRAADYSKDACDSLYSDYHSTMWLMPSAGTLAGMGVEESVGISCPRFDTFWVYNVTTGAVSDMTLALNADGTLGGGANGYTSDCTQNCTYAAGDRLVVVAKAQSACAVANAPKVKGVWLEFDGPQFIASGEGTFSSGTRYQHVYSAWSTTESGLQMPFAAILANLWTYQTAPAATTYQVALCAGAANPPDCASATTTLQVNAGDVWGNDLINTTQIAENQYWALQFANQGAIGNNILWAFELQQQNVGCCDCGAAAACASPDNTNGCPVGCTPGTVSATSRCAQ